MNKDMVFAVIRSSPNPVSFTGLMSQLHRTTGSKDSLAIFTDTEETNVRDVLEQMLQEGRIRSQLVEEYVYEIVQ